MSPGAGWPRWLLITLLVLAVIVLIPLGWMACAMLFGTGMMGGMMDGGMMGMHWVGLLGLALLLVLLVALILFVLRELSRRGAGESGGARTPAEPGDARGPREPE